MPDGENSYLHGYSRASLDEMTRRSAETDAAFFLPYLREDSNVLDCGCGPGSITLGFARLAIRGNVMGIDIADGQIAAATSAATSEKNLSVEFRKADLCEMPFSDESFDAVYVNAVLEHVGDPDRAIAEIFRVLKPGGFTGLRHSVLSSRKWMPPAPQPVLDSEAKWIRNWRVGGGDPDFGLRQAELLETAGFAVVATSSSSHHLDRDRLRRRMVLGGEAGFMTPLRDIGVSVDEIPAVNEAFEQWMQNASACNAMLMMETVAQKSGI